MAPEKSRPAAELSRETSISISASQGYKGEGGSHLGHAELGAGRGEDDRDVAAVGEHRTGPGHIHLDILPELSSVQGLRPPEDQGTSEPEHV